MQDLFDLSGKVALVTGGSRGLGRAICNAFAAHGADLIVASRNLANCELVADEVRAAGRRALAVSAHIGRWSEIDALVDKCYQAFERVDILVNNAGMSPVSPSSVESSEQLWDSVMALNVKGPFRLSALIGQHMASGDGGSIINISSVAALFPAPAYAPYAAAKAALNVLTRAHAAEFAPKVRVNAILPGSFRTDIAKHWPPDKEANTPAVLHRFGEPNEIATAALYFASDHSSFTTGALLQVDGGRI